MRIVIGEESVEVRLALWQKALGLLGDVRIARADIDEAQVVEDPIRDAMGAGVKVGLRVPWLYFIARTIRLDRVFIVRRGVPALSLTLGGEGRLRGVLVSTREAAELADRLKHD
jgi:hypothetical protein